ncbi:polyketide synthase [Aspergillus luchuensis]|uniref:Polyketide synthase n=1 Tax=Aspergillus kawachii TaxID=1069201 RepID=A0A146F876_ASPKA|nr:polyketide synthase [Aspergillus luchuensis]
MDSSRFVRPSSFYSSDVLINPDRGKRLEVIQPGDEYEPIYCQIFTRLLLSVLIKTRPLKPQDKVFCILSSLPEMEPKVDHSDS